MATMEIQHNDKIYSFRFGIGFLKEINKRFKEMPAMGVSVETGFKWQVARMLDGDMSALEDILFTANKTEKPRITLNDLDDYLDDESTDIKALVEEVNDFLLQSNACKELANQVNKNRQELLKEQNQAQTV